MNYNHERLCTYFLDYLLTIRHDTRLEHLWIGSRGDTKEALGVSRTRTHMMEWNAMEYNGWTVCFVCLIHCDTLR